MPFARDPRQMLRTHLARRTIVGLEAGDQRRQAALSSSATFNTWADQVRQTVRRAMSLDGELDGPLNARLINRHEAEHLAVENVLFDSIRGWQVNASAYLPDPAAYPPPWPGVVMPCGHSAKTGPGYQLPAQVFARAGYVAVSFDAPGQNGEKQPGNDHFTDGARCYAVGHCSGRYFVADALRALDYLESREDVDSSYGLAMTGVSGGANTTIFAALLDNRITVCVPVCGPAPRSLHPIQDVYAICPEILSIGRFAEGLDDSDLMIARAPAAQLYIAGRRDEVMTPAMTEALADEVHNAYRQLGAGDAFAFHFDEAGHAYTTAMARRAVRFIDAHLLNNPDRRHVPAFNEDPAMLPAETLYCQPAPEPNMRTITADVAGELRHSRPKLLTRADAAVAVRRLIEGVDEATFTHIRSIPPFQCWMVDVREYLFEHEDDIMVPATGLWPRRKPPWPAIVFCDDRGRWASMRKGGWLTTLAGIFDDVSLCAPAVVSVDVRGWGDTAPCETPYDLASWSGLDRWPTYMAATLDDGLLAQRVRDLAATCRWLVDQPGVDASRIVLAGHGLGGIVALMTAAVIDTAGVVCIESPESIEAIVGQPDHAWPLDVFEPTILQHFDVKDLADVVAPTLMHRARDGKGDILRDQPYSEAIEWIRKITAISEG